MFLLFRPPFPLPHQLTALSWHAKYFLRVWPAPFSGHFVSQGRAWIASKSTPADSAPRSLTTQRPPTPEDGPVVYMQRSELSALLKETRKQANLVKWCLRVLEQRLAKAKSLLDGAYTFEKEYETLQHLREQDNIDLKEHIRFIKAIESRIWRYFGPSTAHGGRQVDADSKRICTICNPNHVYNHRSNLIRHQRTLVHQRNVEKEGEGLESLFLGQHQLEVWHQRQSAVKEKRYWCEACNYAARDDYTLRQHLLTVKHLKNVKRGGALKHGQSAFRCPVCNRGYARADNLNAHFQTKKHQTAERLYKIKEQYRLEQEKHS